MTTDTRPRYPDVYVPLVGEDGNAFAILGRARNAVRRARPDDWQDVFRRYSDEAMAADYDHLLRTTMTWFTTTPHEEDDDGR